MEESDPAPEVAARRWTQIRLGATCQLVVKWLFTVWNAIFGVLGFACMVSGILMLQSDDILVHLKITGLYKGGDIDLIVRYSFVMFGLICVVVSLLGVIGGVRYSVLFLRTYALILILFMMMQISGSIALAVMVQTKLRDSIDESVHETIIERFGMANQEESTSAINFLQKELRCCGGNIGASDYLKSDWYQHAQNPLHHPFWGSTAYTGPYCPPSCCIERAGGSLPQDLHECTVKRNKDYIHPNSCIVSLWKWADEQRPKAISAAFFICLLELALIIFSLWFVSNIKKMNQPQRL